jgi:UDP-3-O-[3-hydroxymyristoyl] N-acetylglucosamine deacetylase/3-hydroxyacyl-[acyl-carrier-protein] dehydratase
LFPARIGNDAAGQPHQGGDINNAIVVVDKPVSNEKLAYLRKVFHRDDVTVERGFLNNAKLRSQNEPARHKLLDSRRRPALVALR